MKSEWIEYDADVRAFNCYRLAENISAITLLKTQLKAFANSRNEFVLLYLEMKSQNGSANKDPAL
ncbi:hypothetical protein V6Z11_A11G349400 [Gossypium hirsutum]|uniref:Uncharacterized protein n=1 Tax=Gossypium tomentosum TaxID=34277 RepID=A0A5D2NHM4_GOSTO|nr:hypothetical protein ES332_A11G352900v1 [Gossypium tomentosum]